MRQRASRVPYGAWVDGGDRGKPGFYLTEALTDDGVRLRTPQPLMPGTRVDFKLLIENEARVFCGEAEVSGFERDSSALRFVDLDAESRAFLDELLAEVTLDS